MVFTTNHCVRFKFIFGIDNKTYNNTKTYSNIFDIIFGVSQGPILGFLLLKNHIRMFTYNTDYNITNYADENISYRSN